MRTWRRWFRSKLRRLLGEPGPIVSACVAIFIALIALDALTKFFLPTLGLHPGTSPSSSFLILAPLLLWRITAMPATIASAGVIGNGIWTANPGGVPNVFSGEDFVYNVADVCIVLGVYATFTVVILHGLVKGYRRL